MSKNYKGGYKIIDLQKHSIESSFDVVGIHKSLKASYGKPLLLTGIVIDGVEKNDVYIEELKVVDGSFLFKVYGYEITIDDDDSVTSEAKEKEIDITDKVKTENFQIAVNSIGDSVFYLIRCSTDGLSSYEIVGKKVKIIDENDYEWYGLVMSLNHMIAGTFTISVESDDFAPANIKSAIMY